MRAILLLIVLALEIVAARPSLAHEIRPAIVTIAPAGTESVEVTVGLNAEALLAQIGPQHSDTDQSPQAGLYKELRASSPDALKARFQAFASQWLEGVTLMLGDRKAKLSLAGIDVPEVGDLALARISQVKLTAPAMNGAQDLQWTYDAKFGPSILRVVGNNGELAATAWLKDGASSERIPLAGAVRAPWWRTAIDYVVLGFTHILPKGLDHILFVVGLYLLSAKLRPLLVQVTAFTIAHSITLALGLYGVVQVSPSIVEPLIAASIAYVAIENIATTKMSAWRPFVVFAFGLLHGLGFAGVLHEIGLPRADFALGLVSFNVGVELGQLAVIALAWLATGALFANRPWYRQRIVVPASIVIALIGLYWTIERIFFSANA